MRSLEAVYDQGGVDALNQAVIERAASDRPFLYLLMDKDRQRRSPAPSPSRPVDELAGRARPGPASASPTPTPTGAAVKRPARGLEERLPGGELLFVGADIGEARGLRGQDRRARCGAPARWWSCWAWPAGVLVSRNVSRNMAGLTDGGRRRARRRPAAPARQVRGAGDEFDELAAGLNDMLDRLERSMAGLRHAGDAIAHDLRSPLTRLRARLEVALIDVEAGKGDPDAGAGTRRWTTPTAC